MKLSEQLEQDNDCGDFGMALEGYSARAEQLEAALESIVRRLDKGDITESALFAMKNTALAGLHNSAV